MRLIGFLVGCAILGMPLCAWGGIDMWNSLQRKMIFFPTSVLAYTPADLGLAYEDVSIQTSDGVTLHGWMVPCDGSEVTLLFFHGNAGNIGDRVENVRLLHEIGLQVFILDYRGYGLSEGSPSEQGLYKDAQAAYTHLLSRDDVNKERTDLLEIGPPADGVRVVVRSAGDRNEFFRLPGKGVEFLAESIGNDLVLGPVELKERGPDLVDLARRVEALGHESAKGQDGEDVPGHVCGGGEGALQDESPAGHPGGEVHGHGSAQGPSEDCDVFLVDVVP